MVSMNDINNSQDAKQEWIKNAKEAATFYYKENPDSLIPFFERELKNLGFEFETSNQTLSFMPRNKKVIIPIVIKHYQLAKEQQKFNEQNHFLSFFQFRGLEEVVPMLLEDYYYEGTPNLTRWIISDCLYQIGSKKFVKEYLDIVTNRKFGRNRQMVVLLLGKLKEERAIPTLIDLLEDEEVRLHTINALGDFKMEELRSCFERFENSTHSGLRKYAKAAINKLDA